jgi:tetratricopeptide (TPR) repeat protein
MGGRVHSPTLVGRVEELQALEAARKRAADADPAVVLVGGEAGVGKTRLVAELAARCTTDGIRVLVGGCVPLGDGALPYAPIVEALRTLLAEVGVGAVRELVGPAWPELARLLPALGEPGPPGQAAQARLFELLLGLLGRLGEQAPLILMVEDLHWADRSTRDLLAFLVRNLRRERLLVVVTYRNDEPSHQRLGPYLAELNRADRVGRLELARLDQAQTVAQLVGILGTAPAAELTDAVFARSEGNPFFTEELLGSIRAGSSELPATVRDLLRGRILALPEPARQVLAVVAVAGRRVPHRLLAAVAGQDDDTLVAMLRTAVAGQLLVTQPGEDGYEFRHALLREVVDADLLPGERVRLHGQYAKALTDRPELAGGPPAVAAAELAAHWDGAGEPARALPARVAAGLRAEHARAFAEADRHYQRALELWEQVADPDRPAGLDRVDLLTRGAEATAQTGTSDRAIGLLEQALGHLDRVSDPVRAARLLSRLGIHRHTVLDHDAALAAFGEAERLLAGFPPSAEQAAVLADHAHGLEAVGRPQEAIPLLEQAITVARLVGAKAEEASALATLACCLDSPEEVERSIALHLEARRLAQEAGDAEILIDTYVPSARPWSWPAAARKRSTTPERATSGPANSAWNMPSAATSPATSPGNCWQPAAGRNASSSPPRSWPPTAGTLRTCTPSWVSCWPAGATSPPRTISSTRHAGQPRPPTATPPGHSGPSWRCGRATIRRRAPPSPKGLAGAPGWNRAERSPSTPVRCMRSPCGWRPTRPSARPPGGPPTT